MNRAYLKFSIRRQGTPEVDVFDITQAIQSEVERSGMEDGFAMLFVPGSTAALTTIEFEPGVITDLKEALERLAPRDIPYAHDQAWGDGNGYAHVRAALVGPSLLVPVEDGKLVTGTWQQVVLLDFDNRTRDRRVTGYLYEAGI